MRSEPLPGFRLSLAIALAAASSCHRASDVVDASAASAATPPEGALTAEFAKVTEKFLHGEIQLRNLIEIAEPILLMERGEPVAKADGWVRRELTLPDNELLTAELLTLPASSRGTREYQLEICGPVSSGLFLQNTIERILTISFGFDASGEPLFGMGLFHDKIARTEDAFETYKQLDAAPVGGVYKLGREESDSYWRPITLRARDLTPEQVDPQVAAVAESSPGHVPTWEYKYGKKAPAAYGQLADILQVYALLK